MIEFPTKLKTDSMISISSILLLLYANYNTLIDMIIGTKIRILYVVGALFIGMIPYIINGIKKIFLPPYAIAMYLMFIVIIVLNNNYDLHKDGTFFFAIRIIVALFFIMYVGEGKEWMRKIPKYIAIIGFPNILATLFFFIFRSSYIIMYKIYGFYPTGTENGQSGYRAGIANHYSQNGTYIVYVFLALIALTLAEKEKKKRKRLLCLVMISFFALLLTGKRGHLLFGLCAVLGTYFFYANGKSILKALKLLSLGGVLCVLFYAASFFIEPIANLISRFATAGKDSESLTRFAMWNLCIEKFKTSPLFGVGWAQFRQLYYENLYLYWYDEKYKFLNAHNVYFQLLCETGIFGTIVYLSILIFNFVTIITTLKKMKKYNVFFQEHIQTLTVSLAIQIFFIAYCTTGNGLYDYSFYFYMLAVSSGLAVTKKAHEKYPFIYI